MSDVSAVLLSKWSGITRAELVQRSIITDEMTDVRDLNDAETCKIYKPFTNEAGEVVKGADRTAGSGTADQVATLQHNPSIEVNEPVYWEDQSKVPVDLIEAKLPVLASKMARAHARRFFAYGVSTVSNFDAGPSTPDHVIDGDFTTANSALNATILDALLTGRNLLVAQGADVNPMETFVAVNPTIFSRCKTIREISGREYTFEGFGGNRRFRAFEYADMTIMESPVGIGEDMSVNGSNSINANTPAKFKKNITDYPGFFWHRQGYAQGFVGGGWRGGVAPPRNHVSLTVNWQFETKAFWLNAAMIYDAVFTYPNSAGDESILGVALKQS